MENYKRSGIIPYYILNNIRYYFIFIDKNYGTIIDGGGHIEEGESSLNAAIRELNEESLFLFSYDYNEIKDITLNISDNNTMIYFLEINISSNEEAYEYCLIFRDRFNTCIEKDNCREET